MVISHCQDHGSIACALRSGLLKAELKEKQPKTTKRLGLRTQSGNKLQPSNSQTSLANPTEHILVHWMDADGSTGPENFWHGTTCLRHKQITRLGIQLTKTVQAKPPEKAEKFPLRLLPFTMHQGRPVFCPVHNSGMDADERRSIEMLASPLLMQKREANPFDNFSLFKRKFSVTPIIHSKHRQTCCDTLTQT